MQSQLYTDAENPAPGSDNSEGCEHRSVGADHEFSDLMSDNAEEYMPIEQQQVDQEDDDYYEQPYNNKEVELMQKLNQEGFFDKDEANDFQICKPRHDLHHSITLCRRVICRIGSTEENVAPITLKLIDLF